MGADGPAWIVDMMMMLGSLSDGEVMTSSISRVSDKIRQAKEKAYEPEIVSIGPFHWKSRGSNLEFMEGIKWRYMHALFAGRIKKGYREVFEKCCHAIRKIDGPVRKSYGDKIELEPEQLAEIMVLDGCFLLEILLRLYHHVTGTPQPKYRKIDLSLKDMDHKLWLVLRDLTLLENQIPFDVLATLADILSKDDSNYNFHTQRWDYIFPTPKELVESLFGVGVGVCHLLHVVHASSIHSYHIKTFDDDPQKLKRCATNLQAVGIKIQTPHAYASGSTGDQAGTMASALREFVEMFDFEIEYKPIERELIIPPLHINEGTEVKWRNLIAWEQCGTGVGYKFTSYAYFFKGLICCVGDIRRLKAKKVIIVHDKNKKIRDQELLKMFQSITIGVERMDRRYNDICNWLNTVEGHRLTEWWTMKWHRAPGFLAWLGQLIINHIKTWIQTFVKEYIPDPWKFLALVAASIYLFLTMLQTYYASRS